MKRFIPIGLLLAALAPAGAAFAQQPAPDPAATATPAPADTEEQPEATQDETPKSVDEKVEELDQKVRILDRKIELDHEAAADKAKTAPAPTAGKDGFSLKSADGAFVLKLRGYVHFDGRFWQSDDKKPAIDTFTLRRVRPILEGTLYKIFDFRIMPDFGEGKTVLQDAYMEGRFSPRFKVRAGKFKEPVGLERLQSATDILFVERALPTNLVPNRDLGVMLSGDLAGGGVSYAAGYFNGVQDGGSADGDTNDDKDVAARLFFQPFVSGDGPLKNLGFGVAGTVGDQAGTAASPNLASYKTPGQQTFFSFRSDGTTAGTVIADGRHTRISPQAYFYRGPFGLLAEYVKSTQAVRRGDNVHDVRDVDATSWQVAASWVLSGGEPTYKSVTPKKPFDLAAHAWGEFEIAARYSHLDIEDAAFPLFANPASSPRAADAWAVGLNWYLSRSLRVMLDYEDTTFDGGATAGDREDEKIVFSRFQVSF